MLVWEASLTLDSIPDKPYYRIGEVAEFLGVETHVLRYWESEFPQLTPRRAPSKHRLYRKADIETLALIKRLLHEEGFTLAGAKRRLSELAGEAPPPAETRPEPAAEPAPQPQIVAELKEILKILE